MHLRLQNMAFPHQVSSIPTSIDPEPKSKTMPKTYCLFGPAPKRMEELYSLHCDNEAFHEYAKLNFTFNRACNYCYRIVGSCHGVLCLTDDHLSYMDNTILWNPSIWKWVRLPELRVTFNSHAGFDHAIGFSFDAKSNDYKVVRIVHLRDSGAMIPPEVDVYTLSARIWRNISHLKFSYVIKARETQAYLKGAAQWIGFDMKRHGVMIVSFHMGDKVFRSTEHPDGVEYIPWTKR
ncbi:F-box protein [Actinidia chinensis var. chinensis]|uniref:F-box protein n=1 Tax=Actinidia chinensis var. chinensis TaxID=1590841 RepID=A0A2R6QXB9_ACTCC|nr:F-box protein [Actinidia chinensis var. chinensis]